MTKNNAFDVIIVGGSYAGLAAGMALGRALKKVLIIDSGQPCNRQTPYSHNFLTRDGTSPKEIVTIAKQQLEKYDTVSFLSDLVVAGIKTDFGFEINTDTSGIWTTKKIIFATGIKDILSEIPGISECWGISVLHCPYCHGYEVRNQKTGILGNGKQGFEHARLISNWTNDLTLYTNGKSDFTYEQILKLEKHKIGIVEAEIEQLEHEKGYLQQIIFKNGDHLPITTLYARSAFVQHSAVPESLGCTLTDEGYLRVDLAQKTTVQSVFACGDNTTPIRTLANAIATGTTTGMMVNKELMEEYF